MSLQRYLLWRNARQHHGRGPAQLTPQEREAVEARSAREAQVIVTALRAPEAGAVAVDQETVDAAAAALISGEREDFLRQLAEAGLDWAQLTGAVAQELRAGGVLEAIGARAVVAESAVRDYYEAQRARMVLPERRAARHILITIDERSPENTRAQAQRRIEAARAAALAGEEFAALALRYSECPSALEGGALGQVRRGQLYPELEAALFALAPGELCLVESTLGFHLLRCDAVQGPEPISYEAAAPSIRRRLESRARERLLRQWLAASAGVDGSAALL